jgi:voltage-gated potassium channel
MNPILEPFHNAFHNTRSETYRIVNIIVWILISLSILLFIIDLSLGATHNWKTLLITLDQVLIFLFAIEYTFRILSFHPASIDVFQLNRVERIQKHIIRRLRFAIQPLNLIDLLTLLGGAPALRGLRALRLLRLLRLIKDTQFFRYSNPFYGMIDAYEKNELLYLLGFFFILMGTTIGGISIYLVEHQHPEASINTIGDGLWWALVTLTTVGYGDITPITGLGKVVGGSMMIVGMFTIALFAGIVGQTLLSSVLSLREEQFRMSSTMKHIVICGYEPSSRMLLDTIDEEFDINVYKPVLFAPYDRPSDIPLEFEWINGDPTKESELEKARLAYADSCLIVSGKRDSPQIADAKSILTVFTIRSFLQTNSIAQKRLKPLYVTVEILDPENVQHAKSAGANEVIESTRLSYSMLSHSIAEKGTGGVLSSIISARAQNIYVIQNVKELPLPMTFDDVCQRMRHEYGILVIGIRDKYLQVETVNPPIDFMVTKNHSIIYLASKSITNKAD